MTMTVEGTAPPLGTLFTVVNADHTAGDTAASVSGPRARIGRPNGIAVASDGTVYLADSSHRVRKLTPQGALSVVAGTGNGGNSGDFGAAVKADLNNPMGLALDEAKNLLYIVDRSNNRIRVVNLTSGLISTYAGGGSAQGPGYGDGGVATAANLYGLRHLSIGPDKALYLSDQNRNGIRRIDPDTTVITTFIQSMNGCSGTEPLKYYDCGGEGCDMAWDKDGLVLGARFCGSAMNTSVTWGIARRNNDGSFTHLAGWYNGSTADGAVATSTTLNQINGIAYDDNENLFFADAQHRIRRIDATSRIVTTVVGTGTAGYSGEYGPTTSATINSPNDLGFTDGHLVFGDEANYCVRLAW
ncbi:MAG: hypothetical protein HY698_09950 [Deltaproteobacteria bacterium]|nr:hypothetical protein [Deltaproteobacteria bacterium]